MLFKVEDCVGDKIACTSKPCAWVVPSSKCKILPLPMEQMEFKTAVYGKKSKLLKVLLSYIVGVLKSLVRDIK